MAHALLLQDLMQPDTDDFAGVLLWFRDWGIWNESSEATAARMLELIRDGLVPNGPSLLHEGPAHLFAPQEFVDAHALLTIPLMFQWDVYVVPVSGRCVALASHDAYVRMTACTPTILTRIQQRFESANWAPEECPPE
jgi:hypothetical protein